MLLVFELIPINNVNNENTVKTNNPSSNNSSSSYTAAYRTVQVETKIPDVFMKSIENFQLEINKFIENKKN